MAPGFQLISLSLSFIFSVLPALFSIASAINVIQRPSATHNNKYAITETWIRKAGTHAADAAMCCPLILSMRSARGAARKALPESEARSTTIDLVLYTEKGSFGDDAVKFMESRGVQVVDSMEDPIMSQALNSQGFSFGEDRLNKEKLVYLWDTRYDAVLQIDYDVLFTEDRAGTVDMLGTVAHGEKSMYTFTSCGSPIAGGILAVRPSEELGTGFLHAVQHGYFRNKEGYGGVYPENITALTSTYRANICSRNPLTLGQPGFIPCCIGEHSDTTAWCFAGAQTDQGILFHLAVDGEQDRRVMQDQQHEWGEVGVWQSTNDPKPWELHKLPELIDTDRLELFRTFRQLWESGQSALLEDDAECTAFYQEQFDIYDTCYTSGMSSSQAKECLDHNFA